MAEQIWFFRSPEEARAIAQRLKRTACPHCKIVGALIRHGYLYGYELGSSRRETVRAQRIFCSNRHRRPGCGRTFSIWCADKIRRLSVNTRTLWRFLQQAVAHSIRRAGRAIGGRSERTWQRLWQRFQRGQARIRTALTPRLPPPEVLARPPSRPQRQPEAQTLAHLQAACPDVPSPIASFQHALHTFFI